MRRAAAIGVGVLAIVAAGCGGPGATHVPSLTDLGPRAAAERLCDLGLIPFTRASVADAGRDPAALATTWLARRGTVLGTVPPAGSRVSAGSSVMVQIRGQAVGPIFVPLDQVCR